MWGLSATRGGTLGTDRLESKYKLTYRTQRFVFKEPMSIKKGSRQVFEFGA